MEIIKTYTQSVPAFRFIGRVYHEDDRVDGSFAAHWGKAFETGLFADLEKIAVPFYEDADAYVGLMRHKEGEPFLYAIGMLTAADTPVPDGYEAIDFPASEFGVCWLYGKEPELYGKEALVMQKLAEQGLSLWLDHEGACWAMERYTCPRFTTPDEQGNIIIDLAFLVTE